MAVILSMSWSLKQTFATVALLRFYRHLWQAHQPAGLERAGLELGYPDSSWG